MSINLGHLGLGIHASNIDSKSRFFRPPSWPPPTDWVCIEDKDVNPVSTYGDHILDFTLWAGKLTTFTFGDGPKIRNDTLVLDPANANLLQQLVTWRGWWQRSFQSVGSLVTTATQYRKVIAICSDNNMHPIL